MSKRTEEMYTKLVDERLEELINLMMEEGKSGIRCGLVRAMSNAIDFYLQNEEEILTTSS